MGSEPKNVSLELLYKGMQVPRIYLPYIKLWNPK